MQSDQNTPSHPFPRRLLPSPTAPVLDSSTISAPLTNDGRPETSQRFSKGLCTVTATLTEENVEGRCDYLIDYNFCRKLTKIALLVSIAIDISWLKLSAQGDKLFANFSTTIYNDYALGDNIKRQLNSHLRGTVVQNRSFLPPDMAELLTIAANVSIRLPHTLL